MGHDHPTAELHDEAARRLGSADQRYTSGRRRVVEVLAAAEGPVAIPDLLEHDRSIPQSSAYRTLAVLEEAEVVRRVTSADEFVRWELAEDLTEHHHHLICTACGSIADVTIPGSLERTLDRAISGIEGDTGFRTDQHRLDLLGRCADCT